jgi:hypothetical protein
MRGTSSVKANSRNYTPRPPVYSQTHFWFVSILASFSKRLLAICPCVLILSFMLLLRHELLISFVKHLHNSRLLLKAANRVSVLFPLFFPRLAAPLFSPPPPPPPCSMWGIQNMWSVWFVTSKPTLNLEEKVCGSDVCKAQALRKEKWNAVT